ncbi:MAG: DUF402 domain-containing protein [Spirochaetales bacterium]|nr:DUF402 domain-containing protein [Spirochaetales bacterium]
MIDVLIKSRLGDIQGKKNDDIAFFDSFDERANRVVRHFILFQYGVKIQYEPFGWVNEWYLDFIDIMEKEDGSLLLHDLYLDLVIEGMGPTYRVLDSDEMAEAFEEGHLDSAKMCQVLKNLQIFVDDHLHRNIDNFPPEAILPYFEVKGV